MNKKTSFLRYLFLFVIAFIAVTFLHWTDVSAASTRNDINVYFFPDGQKHSTVNVDVTIVASTSTVGGFLDLSYEWWFSNPNGDDYALKDENGNIITVDVPAARSQNVIKFSASNFNDRGGVPVDIAGNYYVKVIARTINGESYATSLLYNLRKDTTGRVEIIEITEPNPNGNVGYVWVKINYAGMYTGNNSTISSKVYKIGEEGEWQKYEGQFKVTENTTIFAEYTDGVKTISTQLKISSIDSIPPTIDISYDNDNYENPVLKVTEETSGLASVKYGWVKYNKVNNDYVVDNNGITLWRHADINGYPVGESIFNINIDKLNDVQGDGYYKLHVIAKDRVGNQSGEVVSPEVVVVDFTGPEISFDDRGVHQSQSYYEIIVNVDESEIGLNNEGNKELYFFILPSGEVPFAIIGYENGEPIYDTNDYKSNLLKNLYNEIATNGWAYREESSGKLVIKVSPEYFTMEEIEKFNEKITLYVKAVDEYGNQSLTSTEITYHTTYLLPRAGELFVNAINKDWPFKIAYAQIALVPSFSSQGKEIFKTANEIIDENNIHVYYTTKYGKTIDDNNSFNNLFDDFGSYKKIKNHNDDSWVNNGDWQYSSVYQGGYIGHVVPREIRITENTGSKVVRVMVVDKTTGLCEVYDSYKLDGVVTDLSFNNIDNVGPTINISSNWSTGQKIGQSVIIDFEINDDFGFTKIANVQYQWTNFGPTSHPSVLESLIGNWISVTPKRVSTSQPKYLYSYPTSIIKTVGDGKNYLWIRSVDSVGNASLECKEFIIDTTAPEIDFKIRNTNKIGQNEYVDEKDYHLLLEPTANNSHVKVELRVFDNSPEVSLRLSKVLYRWVPDQGNHDNIEWSTVSTENLMVLNLFGFIDDEINYVANVGTGYYRLQVMAVDIAGNESETISSPPFYIINRAPYEPSLVPILVYDEGAEFGVIEVEIHTNDPTVDEIFKYAINKNSEFDRLYNPISKPTYEYSINPQYLKAKSINMVGSISLGQSDLNILPKWFYVPKVEINNMGSNNPISLSQVKSELENIRYLKYNAEISTSYSSTGYSFDKVEFAITSSLINLDNISGEEIKWYDNLTSTDIERLITNDGVYRLWVRVYNEYQITPVNGQVVKKPLSIGYDFVDYNVDMTSPVVNVFDQELIYADKELNLLDNTLVKFNDDVNDLNIKIKVNGEIIEGYTIPQDAGIYYITYIVTDKAGNTSTSSELTVSIRNIITLFGDSSSQMIYPLFGEAVFLNSYLPDIPKNRDFDGWYTESTLENKVDNIIVGSKPISLYAGYTYSSVTIFFDANGGVVNPSSINVPYGSSSHNLVTPTRLNHSFVGWFLGDVEFTSTSIITEDVTLVARWQGRDLTVTIDADNETEPTEIVVKYGKTLGSINEPIKEGYIFEGWYYQGKKVQEDSIVTEDMTIIARYTPIKYTITQVLNNGQANIITYRDYGTTLEINQIPIKEGHNFDGWYINEELTVQYDFETNIVGNLTLYAKWQKRLYTVSFNPGEGIFSIEEQNVLWMEKLIQPEGTPTRTNYVFDGWYINIEKNIKYDFSSLVTSDITLHAKWVGEERTITFKPANGDSDFVIKTPYGESIDEPFNIPIRSGFNFVGWYISLTDEFSFDFTTEITTNISLTAKWEIQEFSITIDFNNNQDIVYLIQNYNTTVARPTINSKEGYTFVGWKFNGSDGVFPYTVTNDVVIEAIWEPIDLEVVFYDGYQDYYSVMVKYDGVIEPINLPSRQGYNFRGWFIDQELTQIYSFNELITSSFTLYARWDIKQYRLAYNTNGGSYIPIYFGEYNSSLSHLNPITTKEGYIFKGWYKDVLQTEIFDFKNEVLTNDLTIYAKWEGQDYNFIFDTMCEDVVVNPYILQYGDIVYKPLELVRDGYHFAGWFTSPEFTETFIFGSRMPARDVTVYAKWLKEYNVTFFDDNTVINRIKVAADSRLVEPNNPTKAGSQFMGWYIDSTLETPYDFNTIVSGNIDLFAKWGPKLTTITFDSNGGSLITPIVGLYGELIELPTPFKIGHNFTGWITPEGQYSSIIIPNEDINLIATWEAQIYTVSFDTDGGNLLEPLNVPFGTSLVNIASPVKIGFNFVGWSLDGDLTIIDTMPARDVVLFAIWSREFTPGLIFEPTADSLAYVVSGYTGSSKSVYIPNYYNGKPVIGIKDNAFLNKTHVTSLVISQNITSIGTKSIYGMTNLSTVLFEENSGLKSIGNNAFQNTIRLTSINLPLGLESIGANAFTSSGLTSIVIPKTVTSLGVGVFSNMKSLTSACFAEGAVINSLPIDMFRYSNIESFVVPNSVTTIGNYAFANLVNLKSIVIPASVTKLGTYILRYSINLEELTTPGNVTIMSYFYSSTDMSRVLRKINVAEGSVSVINSFMTNLLTITDVTLPEGLISIGDYAFSGATNLRSINIPDSLQSIGINSFYKTTSLLNVKFGLNSKLNSIGNTAFAYSGLTDLVIPKSVTNLGLGVFSNMKNLLTARFEEGTQIKILPADMFRYSNITSFVVPSSVTNIGAYAFSNLLNLKSIVIPSNVTTFGSYILRYSVNLEELTTPGHVTIMSYFYRASDMSKVLTKVNVAPGSTFVVANFMNAITQVVEVTLPDGIITINDNAFSGATGLQSINIPNSLEKIGASAFYNTTSLSNLVFTPDSNIREIGNSAFRLSGITSIYLPKSLTILGTSTFEQSKLQEVVFAEDSTITYISHSMFRDTKDLKKINIPLSILEIRDYAFYGSGLGKVVIPKSVTKVNGYAFANMSSLTEIHFPTSVTSFGACVLRSSTNLQELTIPGNKTVASLFYATTYTTAYMSKVLTKVNVAEGSTTVVAAFLNGINHITDVTLPEGLISIGDNAFNGVTNLQRINMPDSLELIGISAFIRTANLSEITFGLNSNLKTINSNAFNNSGIRSIVIPKSVTTIGVGAFSYTKNLLTASFEMGTLITTLPADMFRYSNITSFIVPSTVTNIGAYAFSSATNLKTIVIPASVTTFGTYILRYSINLEEITVPGHVTVTSLFYNFTDMSKVLTKVNVSNGSTVIANSFIANLNQIVEVNLPDGIITIGDSAFSGAINLSIINIPTSIEKIGVEAFYNTKSLLNIVIPEDSKLKEIGNSAFKLSAITSIFIPKRITIIGTNVFELTPNLNEVIFSPEIELSYISISMFRDAKALKGISLPNTILEIRDYAFYGSGISKITIPNSVTRVNLYAFGNMKSLVEIHFPVSVTTFGYSVLRDSTNLQEITIPGNKTVASLFYSTTYSTANMSKVLTRVNVANGSTTVVAAFLNAIPHVSDVKLPDGLISIGDNAFNGVTNLRLINLPDSISSIGASAFYNTTSLRTIKFGENSNLTNIGVSAFNGSGITSIVIPKSVITIGTSCFANTKQLLSASFEHGTQIKLLPVDMFRYSNIASFIVPDTVTNIGAYAFSSATNLRSIVIPSSVITFGTYILRYSINVEEITIPGNVTVTSLFYNYTDMSKVLLKVNISDGSTTVAASFMAGLPQIQEVKLPDGIITIGASAFSGATKLSKINIPNSVQVIGDSAFYNTTSLRILIIDESSSIYQIGNSAFQLSGINFIYLPKGVRIVGTSVFQQASNLNNVTFSSEINLTYLSINMFRETSSLQSIKLPNSILDIRDYAFYNSGLISIVIPSGVTKVGSYAFANMAALTEIHFPTSATFGYYVLRDCPKLYELTLPGNETVASLFYASTYTTTYISKELTKVNVALGSTTIKASFLSGIPHVKEVVLPEGLVSIGDSAFSGATGLTTINIPYSVEVIAASAFLNTPNLNLSLLDYSYKFKTIGASAFSGSGIEKFYFPETLTSLGTNVFQNATNLNEVVFSPDLSLLTIPNYTFQGTTSLTNINLPSTLTSLGTYAFDKSGLVSITLPEGFKTLNHYSLTNMDNLTEVNFPNGVVIPASTTRVLTGSNNITKIAIPGTYVLSRYFYGGSIPNTLTEVIISEGSTSILASFLNGATMVNKVTLPSTLTSIAANSFQVTYPLDTLIVNAENVPTLGSNIALENNEMLKVYVSNSSLENYKLSWSSLEDKLYSIVE